MPEGTVFFPDEPVLRVTAPLPQAQLVETRLINLVHFQTVIASKAARMVLAAPGKQLVDFGLRRAHGAEAGLLAARASYLAGFAGTATVLAGRDFGIPIVGTMAHSFVQAHDDEATAFERFARVRPKALTLLIDTYDTERGAAIVAGLRRALPRKASRSARCGWTAATSRAHARAVRAILDAAGLQAIRIFASGGLDEHSLLSLCRGGAPIDGFGVGTSLTTSSDAPALDCAYKLQEYAGRPRRKRSEGKATWPGRKQVYRRYHAGRDHRRRRGCADRRSRWTARRCCGPPCAAAGAWTVLPGLAEARAHAAASLARLPETLRRLEPGRVPVEISQGIRRLAAEMDRSAAAGSRAVTARRQRSDEQDAVIDFLSRSRELRSARRRGRADRDPLLDRLPGRRIAPTS